MCSRAPRSLSLCLKQFRTENRYALFLELLWGRSAFVFHGNAETVRHFTWMTGPDGPRRRRRLP
ncbi:hypothetical protein C1M53_06990 [Mesorhizobium sp. Pch-S]|nr:hypothetical protein C1M53_06990 [Mesorhizobium sp. Pch-S]